LSYFSDKVWLKSLVNLANIFEKLNNLNLKLQGRVQISSSFEGTKSKGKLRMIRDLHCQTLIHEFRIWPQGSKMGSCIEHISEIQSPFEIECYEIHFCGINRCRFVVYKVVVVCCFFGKIRSISVVIRCIFWKCYNIIYNEKTTGRGRRLCANNEGVTNCKRMKNTALNQGCPKCGIRAHFTWLAALFSDCVVHGLPKHGSRFCV